MQKTEDRYDPEGGRAVEYRSCGIVEERRYEEGYRERMRTALVLTGEAGNDKKYDVKPDLVCRDLLDAVEKILQMD